MSPIRETVKVLHWTEYPTGHVSVIPLYLSGSVCNAPTVTISHVRASVTERRLVDWTVDVQARKRLST
jgi:hypothetical protein